MKFEAYLIAFLSLALAGCNAQNPASQSGSGISQNATKTFPVDSLPLASELGEAKDTLVVGLPIDVRNFNPVLSPNAYEYFLQWELFLPLVRYYSGQSRWEPVLADKLDWSKDKTKLIMTLKKGYTWSDGQPLTAEDVKFTYDVMTDPRVGSLNVSYRKNMVAGWDPKVIDEHTLEWHFKHAYDAHQMMMHLSAKLVPKHILDGVDPTHFAEHAFNEKPVTSGPWVVGEKQANERIIFIPNLNFHGPETMRPRLKSVVFRIIPDNVTRGLELEQGNVDMVFSASQEDADRWAGTHPELKIYLRKYTHVAFMSYGLADLDDLRAKKSRLKKDEILDWSTVEPHPIFGDVMVRRALAKAVNVQAIIDRVWTSRASNKPFAEPAVSVVSPVFDGVTPKVMPIPYSPEKARQELSVAGWRDTNGNGILDKDGREFVFTMLTLPSAKAALMIQGDLRKVGIDVRIENTAGSNLIGHVYSGEYEAYLLGGWAEASNMSTSWDPQANGGASKYANPQIHHLLEQVWHEPDAASSNALLRQVQELYYADQELLFLAWDHPLAVINQRFHGMQTQDLISPLSDLHNWWVQPGEIKYQ